MAAHAFSTSTCEVEAVSICEFKAGLVYVVSSRLSEPQGEKDTSKGCNSI